MGPTQKRTQTEEDLVPNGIRRPESEKDLGPGPEQDWTRARLDPSKTFQSIVLVDFRTATITAPEFSLAETVILIS